MKKILLLSFSIITFFLNAQTTFTYSGIGEWVEEANWSPSYPGTIVDVGDTVIIAEDAEVTASGTTINGTIIVKGNLSSVSTFRMNGYGLIEGVFNPRSTLNINDTLLVTGNLQTSSACNVNGILINQGLWNARSSTNNYGTIVNDSLIHNQSSFNNYGHLNGNGEFQNSSSLNGNNLSHTGNVTLAQSLNPRTIDSQIGTYKFDSNFTSSSAFRLNIGFLNDSIDKIIVKDTAHLSGTLSISLLEDYIPSFSFKDTILSASKVEGFFTTTNLPDLEDYELFLTYTDNAVILEVTERVTSFTYVGIGNWTDVRNWIPRYPGNSLAEGETVTIADTAEVSTSSLTINGSLLILGSLTSSSTLNINGEIFNEGYLNTRSSFNMNGYFLNNGDYFSQSSSRTYGTFDNKGTVSYASTSYNYGVINNDSTIQTRTFYNYGELNNNSSFTVLSTLHGENISHTNNVILTNDLSPSKLTSEIGTYTFNANVMFSSNSELEIDLLNDSTDLVIVSDTAKLDGEVNFTLGDDYIPPLGFIKTILEADHIEGTFDTYNNVISEDFELSIIYTDTTVSIEVKERTTEFTYVGIGDWTDTENWIPRYPGNSVVEDETVIIADTAELTTSSRTINGTLVIIGNMESRSALTLNGSTLNNGTLTSRSSLNNYGHFINNGDYTSNSVYRNYGVFDNESEFNANSITDNFGVLNNNGVFSTGSFFSNYGEFNSSIPMSITRLFGSNVSHTNKVEISQLLSPENPDSKIGIYTFDSTVTFAQNVNIVISILNDSSDQIIVKDTLYLDGTLEIELADDFIPSAGYTDTIIKAGMIVGNVENEDFPELSGSNKFVTYYTDTTVIIEVVDEELIGLDDKVGLNMIKLFPNPAQDLITIQGIHNSENVSVYSTSGLVVKTLEINPENNTLLIKELDSGVYYLSVSNQIIRFIKQ